MKKKSVPKSFQWHGELCLLDSMNMDTLSLTMKYTKYTTNIYTPTIGNEKYHGNLVSKVVFIKPTKQTLLCLILSNLDAKLYDLYLV